MTQQGKYDRTQVISGNTSLENLLKEAADAMIAAKEEATTKALPGAKKKQGKTRPRPRARGGISDIIHCSGADLKSAVEQVEKNGIRGFSPWDTARDGTLSGLLDVLGRSLDRQGRRIDTLKTLISDIKNDKVGQARYAREKAAAEKKIAS